MPLDACIAKVKTLSDQDASFLLQAMADGATENEAMDMLGQDIEDHVGEIQSLVEQAGGTVQREGQDQRSIDQQAEDAKWSAWESEMTGTGKVKGAPEWVNNSADPKATELEMERELFKRIEEGATGRYWYEESTQRILDITQGDLVEAEKFIQLIAIFSPQSTVQVNTGFAVTAYNQWKRGEQIQVKTGEQNKKAEQVLYHDKPFDGRKTDSFYQNLMYDLVKSHPESLDVLQLDKELIDNLDKPATIDLWMARAFGYENDSLSDDKGTGKYSYSENWVRRATAKLNNALEPGADRWTPHQVQASVWSAMKARYEIPAVKLATNLESVKKGHSKKVKGRFERVDAKADTKREHLKIWRKHAMEVPTEMAAEASEQSSASFETFIDQMLEIVTWESMPSESLGLDINQATPEQKRAFMRESLQVIVDENGTDQLAGLVGAPINFINTGLGAFEGNVNENALTHLLPEKLPGGKGFDRAKVRLYAQAIQYIYKQDMVPWFRADPMALTSKKAQEEQLFKIVSAKTGQLARKSKAITQNKFATQAEAQAVLDTLGPEYSLKGGKYATAVALQFDRKLSPADADSVLQLLESVFGENAGFTKTASNEISVVNFRDDETGVPFMTDEIFDDGLNTIGPQLEALGIVEAVDFHTEGEGGYWHDWTEDPSGKAVLAQEGISGRSDLQAWVRGRRKDFEQILERYQGEELAKREVENQEVRYLAQGGQPPASAQPPPFDTAFGHETASISQLKGYEQAHAPERAEKFLKETIAGQRPARRPVSVRRDADGTFTVLDGRSAVQAAKNLGYKDMPIRVIDDVRSLDTREVVETTPEVDEMYAVAARAKDKLDKPMESIAAQMNGTWQDSNLKGRGRTQWKVDNEYNGDASQIKDVLRGTLSVANMQDANYAMGVVIEQFGFRNMIKQRNTLDEFATINLDGYRDINLVFEINGAKAEIQINTRDQLVAKEYGHQLYDAYRESENWDMIKDLQTIEQKMYRDSYRLAKAGVTSFESALKVVQARVLDAERMNELYGLDLNFSKSLEDTLKPLWAAEPGGNFRGGSVSHARQVLVTKSSVTGMPSTSSKSVVSGRFDKDSSIVDTSTTSVAEPRMLEQPERGRFFPDVSGRRIIQLTESSDLSTFLHESSHLFLDVQQLWAEKYGMNDNQQAMLNWLGATSFDEITDEQHEQWAETFEVYLREGKAPSIGLRRAFSSFTRWLKRLYRTLSDPRLTRAKLDPEITEIFDRMLATEQEIELARSTPEYGELFQSQEQAGMTDAQWTRYKKLATKKNETAEETLDAKVMKQYKKMKSKEWADEKKPIVEAEKVRLSKEKMFQLMSDMAVIKDDKGEVVSDGRVDWHKLRDAIGEWPNGKNWIGKAVGGGVDPGIYAEAYGFASVKDMYNQMKESPTLNQAADQAAEAKMVEKHGDILNDGTLEQEVREAMLNDDQAELLLMELKASGRTTVQKINRANLKHEADALIRTYRYKQIRPNKFYNQMIKAAKAAAAAGAKGEDAAQHKINQLANHYLYKAAMDARTKMEKGRKKLRDVQNRKYNPQTVDEAYIEAMKNLALSYDMRLTPVERAQYARNVLDFYEGQTNPENENAELVNLEMLDPNVVAAIKYRHQNGSLQGFELKTFDEMTVDEVGGVVDMLDHLRYVGGQVANKSSLEAAKIREAGIESIEENGGKDSKLQRGKQRSLKMTRLTWGDMVNSIPSLGNMIRKLDGWKEGGWALEHILKPINDAVSRKFELQRGMFLQLEGFMSQMPRVGLKENDAMPFTKEDGTEDDFTSSEVFMMAVYWGTESSREAIMRGHALTENDVMELMTRMTPEQLELVNQVWAMNESQWPELQTAAKAMLGVAPPKLQATPFTVNGVQMTGGHMQLMYDSQALQLEEEQQRGMNTSNVVPMQAGSTHGRKGSGGMPVLLDTRNITRSVDEKTHYIAFAETGRHLRSLLNNKEIQNKIEKKHGAPFYENLVHAVTSISRAEPARETSKWLARLSRHMRGAATMMHLAYSIRNVAQQFSAIPIAAREVGVGKWAQSMAHFASRPMQVKAMVDEKSKFMENRAMVVNREAKEYLKKVMATSKGQAMWQAVKARGFILQTLVDSTVAYPTWHARYQTAMENHGDEKRAVIEADLSVAESVGSGSDLHLGRIMQSNQNEFVKTLTVFGSWFNAYYQRMYKSSKGGEDFLSGAFLMDGLLMPIIVANFAQVLIMDIPDDDEEYLEWATENTFKFMLGTMPLIRDVASAWEGFAPTMPISAVATAPVRLKQELESYAKGNQSGLKLTADVGRTLGSVMPLPGSGNLWRLLDYTDSYLDGKEGKTYNIYQAVAEGRDKNK